MTQSGLLSRAFLIAAIVGCAKKDAGVSDSAGSAPGDGRLQVSEKGFGPLTAGMSVAQGEAAL